MRARLEVNGPTDSATQTIDDLRSIEHIPPTSEDRRKVDLFLSGNIISWLGGRLNPDDRKMFDEIQLKLRRDLSLRAASLLEKIICALPKEKAFRVCNWLDEIIFEQARTIGPRIFWSREVLWRVLEWEREQNGDRLFERLGKELALRWGANRGRAKVPLDPKMRGFRKELLDEIGMLRNQLRARFTSSILPDKNKIRDLMQQMIRDPSQPLERLRSNATAFVMFLEKEPLWLIDLVNGKITPAMVADAFLAFGTGRSEEALRQAISRMKDQLPPDSAG